MKTVMLLIGLCLGYLLHFAVAVLVSEDYRKFVIKKLDTDKKGEVR